MKRIIYLGTRFVVVAALFLGLVAFGCHGGSVSDSEDIGSGGDDGAVAGDQVTIGDQVVSDRSILLAFGAEVSPSASIAKADSIGMTQAQVEAGITIVDSGDVRVDGADLHTIWAADGMSARIHGPFRWCETYTVTIAGLGAEGGDVSTPVTMAKNPDDFDGIVEEDDFCTADLPVLFDYLETVWVFRGSDVIDPSQLGYQISLASPPAIDGLWEYTVNSSGAGINNLGDTVGDGK